MEIKINNNTKITHNQERKINDLRTSNNKEEEKGDYIYNFLKCLEILSDEKEYEIFISNFLNPLTRNLADEGQKFYNNKEKIKNLYKTSIENIIGKKGGQNLKKIVKIYCENIFGVFSYILSQNFSDIFIVDRKISCTASNSHNSTDIIIPEELVPVYNKLVDTLIDMTLYTSGLDKTKFDRTNAILDYSTKGIRFNVVEKSLNAAVDRPIIAIRKQIIKQSIGVNKDYLESIGATKKQQDYINYLSGNKSFIIFGETGSGKTTLMKYMGNYNIKNKRNLISIEDTPELFFPVNITYLTNDKYSISKLFETALRENPSHMIVGETRSEEIVNILESGLVFKVGTTLHADSFEKMIMRIVFMVKSSKNDYSTKDIMTLFTSVVDGAVYMKDRKIVEVWGKNKDIQNYEDIFNNYHKIE